MFNKSTLISLGALILIGMGVLRTKYEVVFLRKTLRDLEIELEKSTESLNILSAEWSYLNDPSRLEKLCEKYLKGMRPTENSQVIRYEDLDKCTFNQKGDVQKGDAGKENIGKELTDHSKKQSTKRELQKKSFDEFIKNSLNNSMKEQYN
jgi:hypothetical protein